MTDRDTKQLLINPNKCKFSKVSPAFHHIVAAGVLLICLLFPAEGRSHEIRPIIGTVGLTPAGNLELVLTLNLEAAMAGIGSNHKDTKESSQAPVYDRLRALTADQLLTEFKSFEGTLRERIEITADGRRTEFGEARIAIPEAGDLTLPRISTLTLTTPSPVSPRIFTWRFDPTLGDSVMRFRAVGSPKIVRAELAAAGAAGGPVALDGLSPQSLTSVLVTYAKLGFVHIVPKGLDHILFVLGLFLLSTRLSALLWQISAFTLAHTATLALGASGLASLSPAIVEPLIAASIVYVAVENLFTDKLMRWRPPVVFAFGLLHGLGFAGVLGEIGLPAGYFFPSLIAFNIGVELGQLAVIAAAFLVIGWAASKPWYHHRITIPASALIAVIATGWFLQRVGVF